MKTCPTCQRTYDDEIRFCLEDGGVLERSGEFASPTMTMPAAPVFQAPPPPPTLVMPVEPSLSTPGALAGIFISPGRVFESFRDVTTFGPAAVRFLAAAAIVILALVLFNLLYVVKVGPDTITRASLEANARTGNLPAEQKEQMLKVMENPTFQWGTLVGRFVGLVGFLILSFPLGALAYWVGALLFKSKLSYLQALLVWTYSMLATSLIWVIVNTVALFLWPPATNVAIALDANAGVIHANLGAFAEPTTLPASVTSAALGAFDLFALYGLVLATLGLRTVGRLPWIGALVTVLLVWLVGMGWRVAMAEVASMFIK
jgi:hypothetical protein